MESRKVAIFGLEVAESRNLSNGVS